jgi:small subunit ribosomal protein S15
VTHTQRGPPCGYAPHGFTGALKECYGVEQRGDHGFLKTGHWQLCTELCYSRTRYENEKRQECNRLVLARERKQSVVDTYRTHATDTGSPEVQIALLSERIGQLTEHFKAHQKDHGSRRGLLMMVSRRRSLLDYLKKYDSERYKTVISKLGIRK